MLFTVFTPTFNRAHTLYRVYDSLCHQSFRSFEWLVIDDGSSDNTEQLVNSWIVEAEFPIRYVKQVNSGKNVAINRAVWLAEGELFLIADSDDALPSYALQVFYDHWMSIPENIRLGFSGVEGLCVDGNGQAIGNRYPTSPFDSTYADRVYKYGIYGEKSCFTRTDIMKKFPMPEPLGYEFVSEGLIWDAIGREYKTRKVGSGAPMSLIWNAIGREYKTRHINDIVRYYFQDAGNQVSNRSPQLISPSRIFYAMTLDNNIEYLTVSRFAPWMLFRTAIHGVRLSLHQRDSFSVQIKRLKKWRARCVWMLAMPAGILVFLIDLLGFSRILSVFKTIR